MPILTREIDDAFADKGSNESYLHRELGKGPVIPIHWRRASDIIPGKPYQLSRLGQWGRERIRREEPDLQLDPDRLQELATPDIEDASDGSGSALSQSSTSDDSGSAFDQSSTSAPGTTLNAASTSMQGTQS
jgi:hypothetical protein